MSFPSQKHQSPCIRRLPSPHVRRSRQSLHRGHPSSTGGGSTECQRRADRAGRQHRRPQRPLRLRVRIEVIWFVCPFHDVPLP